MKIKISEATNLQLDWLAAKANGATQLWLESFVMDAFTVRFTPTTDWAQGGPIIEREKIEVVPSHNGKVWYAESLDRTARADSCPTALIAAMRCYVASKLGDEVEIPDGLS